MHDSGSVLDPARPHARVGAAIGPAHRAETVALVTLIKTVVRVSALPLETTPAVLFVHLVLAYIGVEPRSFAVVVRSTFPLALPMLVSLLELASV